MAHVVLLLQDLSTWPSCCYSGGSVGGFKQNHPKRWLLHCMHGISGENVSSHTGLIRESLSMHYPQICALYLLFYRPFEWFPSIFFSFIHSPTSRVKGLESAVSMHLTKTQTEKSFYCIWKELGMHLQTASCIRVCALSRQNYQVINSFRGPVSH